MQYSHYFKLPAQKICTYSSICDYISSYVGERFWYKDRFKTGLKKIKESLTKPHGEKKIEKITERIGRLKEKSRGISQHYEIELTKDESGKLLTAITWNKATKAGTAASHPGVYCLRSNETGWDEEKLWHTYTMLTDSL